MSVQPLKASTHAIFWGCTAALFLIFIFVFKAVLLPFVLGIAVAYLLNPLVNRLGDIGFARPPATLMILFGFMILILGFMAAMTPILYRELMELKDDLPLYLDKLMTLADPLTDFVQEYLGGADPQKLTEVLKNNSASAAGITNAIIQKIAAGGQAVMDMISVMVFMPIVAYFMMIEWPSITKWVCGLIPRHSEETIMNLLIEIDKKLSGFVRGQISVAVILGITYAVALSIAGLKYGFLIGIGSGLLSVIPMVGSIVGLLLSVAVAWFQSGEITFVLIIAGIFIAGQIIEGNFLTPKLVGDSVGLHPLWVFFALLAGGSLLGILGMFLAVPVAAVIGVLLSYAIYRYKQSPYYKDEEKAASEIKQKENAQEKKKKTAKKKAVSKTEKGAP